MRVQGRGGGAARGQKDVAMTLGANIGLAGMNAATGIVLARVLGPEGRGQLQAAQLWGLVFGTFAALGIPEAVVYFVARRRDEAGRITASAMAAGLLSSVFFVALGWFVVPLVLGGQPEDVKVLAQRFLLVVPFFVLVWIVAQALRGLSLFARWNVLRVLQTGIWLAFVLGAWLTGRFSIATMAYGFIASLALQLAINLFVFLRSAPGPYRIETQRWAPTLRFGLPNVLASAPKILNVQLDQLLLAAFVPSEQLGLYVVAVAWSGAMAPVLQALGYVLFPRVAGEESETQRLQLVARGFRIAVVVATVSGVGLLLLTYPGMRLLFGASYVPAIPTAFVLVVAGGVLTIANVIQEGFRGLGRPSEVLWSELIGLAATGVLLAALLPTLGIMGAGIASVGGYSATVAVLLVRLRRGSGSALHGNLMPGSADVADVVRSVRALVRRKDADDKP